MRFFLFSIIICLSSCGQLSSLQTAKVLEKGKATIGGAAFGYGLQDKDAIGGELGSGILPHVEIWSRYGVSNSFDLGLKLSTGGNALLNGKLQFVGNPKSNFAAAIGGGFELQASNFQEVFVYRLHLPLYLSWHPSEKSALYFTPRYVHQSVSDSDNSYFLGGGFGYQNQFSSKFSGLIELSGFTPQTKNTTNETAIIYQFGIGGVYHFGN